MTGGACSFAYCSRRSNCLLCCDGRHGAIAKRFQTAAESVRLLGHAHLLIESLPGARNVQQRVFLGAVDSHMIIAAHTGIYELDIDVFADALEVAVMPVSNG